MAGASATAGAHGQRALARDLDAAAAAVRSSIRSLRTLLVDIYPASLARSGIVAALHDLAQTTRRDDLVVHVDTADEDDLALSTDAQRLVHRVAQECLRNAARHAGPATVTVSLHRDGPGTVTLDIVDDGAGFDVQQVRSAPRDGHLGLQLLADAASVPGALLQVSSAPGPRNPLAARARRRAGGHRVIRVLLVDDHQLVRAGVKTLLQSDPEITVVGEARNGREAVESVEGSAPDVVLMDLSMPEMDGVEATRGVLARRPDTKVLVLTSFSDRQRVKDVLAAGAIGYVLKDSEPADLLAAVHAAALGHVPIDPRVAAALLPSSGGSGGTGAADGLSPRETEVLRLVAQGLANKQIARALGITERTVKAHLGRVFREIGVLDRTSAALWARDNLPGA